jgi:hypothetical protein
MTKREIYFKGLISTDFPVGRIGYICKDEHGVIQIGRNVCVRFSTKESVCAENLELMREIESRPGFICWNCSEEGESLIREACASLAKQIKLRGVFTD